MLLLRMHGYWSKIMNNNFFKLLYHVIFIIPCTVLYFTNYIWEQIKETPYVAWIILLAGNNRSWVILFNSNNQKLYISTFGYKN